MSYRMRLKVIAVGASMSILVATSSLVWSELPSPNKAIDAHKKDVYRLVWSDEFTSDGPLDPARWTHERGLVRNNELQCYQAANAYCKDGVLVLEARRERVKNPHYDASSRQWGRQRSHADFTSASVTTEGRAAWQYGRFEMRGRIDVRLGMWPAYWTLGVDAPWPARGEIDMMEYYRGELLANAAWSDSRGEPSWDSVRTPLEELGRDWAKEFHVWRMDWDADRIALYVDGRLLNEVDLTKTINQTPDAKNPFRQPHFLLLSQAVGGTNGGDPAETKFPARFEVDYVRVYQKP